MQPIQQLTPLLLLLAVRVDNAASSAPALQLKTGSDAAPSQPRTDLVERGLAPPLNNLRFGPPTRTPGALGHDSCTIEVLTGL